MEHLSDENRKAYTRLMRVINKHGSPRSNHSLSGCWSHTTSVSGNGYGQITVDKKAWNLHRLSWWLHNGCPTEGNFISRKYHISHACDNKECANPDHLSLETAQQNVIEAVTRIRVINPVVVPTRARVACNACRADTHHACVGFPCTQCVKAKIECIKEEYIPTPQAFKKGDHVGEANVKAKLTGEQVLEIRRRKAAGLPRGGLQKLAEEFAVSYITIQAIVGGRLWNQPQYFPTPL